MHGAWMTSWTVHLNSTYEVLRSRDQLSSFFSFLEATELRLTCPFFASIGSTEYEERRMIMSMVRKGKKVELGISHVQFFFRFFPSAHLRGPSRNNLGNNGNCSFSESLWGGVKVFRGKDIRTHEHAYRSMAGHCKLMICSLELAWACRGKENISSMKNLACLAFLRVRYGPSYSHVTSSRPRLRFFARYAFLPHSNIQSRSIQRVMSSLLLKLYEWHPIGILSPEKSMEATSKDLVEIVSYSEIFIFFIFIFQRNGIETYLRFHLLDQWWYTIPFSGIFLGCHLWSWDDGHSERLQEFWIIFLFIFLLSHGDLWERLDGLLPVGREPCRWEHLFSICSYPAETLSFFFKKKTFLREVFPNWVLHWVLVLG